MTSYPSNSDNRRQMVVIDADPANLDLVSSAFEDEPLAVITTTNAADGLELIRTRRPQIVLLDSMMSGIAGLEMLERIIETDPGIDIVLMTDQYTAESAVEAIKKGACDYLPKPISVAQLQDRIGLLLSAAQHRQYTGALDQELMETFQFEGMVGRSPQMLELFRKIHRVAKHFNTVLLIGDTGTGKELAAKALHRLGSSPSGPFVACNCSALAESLLETELFGAVKGAYTGAVQDRRGIFEHANGGTLVLDEIGDMPLGTQAKLLRVLQNQEIQRVGSPVVHKVNARVVVATNRDLRTMVAAGKFREDLYYRLSMLEIRLPSLAERKEDLPLLQRYFVQALSTQCHKPIRGLTRRVQTVLSRYSWPGNVRELENVIGHACIMTEAEVIDICDLPEHLRANNDLPSSNEGKEGVLPLHELQRRYARQVVARFGNKAQAADLLGISRTKLYRLLSNEPLDHEEKESAKA
jgi:DNA-binding NtrC family response regulator